MRGNPDPDTMRSSYEAPAGSLLRPQYQPFVVVLDPRAVLRLRPPGPHIALRIDDFGCQKGNPVPRSQKHPLLRKIASRRRRLERTGGRLHGIDLEDQSLKLDQTRYSTLLGERILTARETEVLYHVARGQTDKEIAENLFVSRRTVSNHVSNILNKLAVANRREAVRAAFRIGLI